MRKRAILLAAAAVAMLAIGLSGLAGADESVQVERAKVKPKKLPKRGHKNIKLINTIVTRNEPGKGQPKSATRTVLDLPKQLKIHNKSVAYCKGTPTELQFASTRAEARKVCGRRSQVSKDGGSSAKVTVANAMDPSNPTIIDVDVTAFNAKHKKMLLWSKPTGPAQGIPASILVGKLKRSKAGRAYRKALDVKVPKLDAGAISYFKVTVKKGRYLQAKCKPKRMKFQAKTFFDDGTTTTDTDTVKCKPKAKKRHHHKRKHHRHKRHHHRR